MDTTVKIEDSKRQEEFHLNVRSQLFFMFAINGVLIGNVKAAVIWALVMFAGLLLILMKHPRTAIKYILTYGVMYGLENVLMLLPHHMIFDMVIIVSSVLRRFIPYFMIGSLILQTTTVGMLMASMERLHLSKKFIIPFAVILRFFPSVKEEWSCIKDAMKLRGIGLSAVNVLTHPAKNMEYILVPLLTSSIKIGDELSAASVARGLGMERTRTSIYDVSFCLWDYMLFASAVIFFLLITFL